MHNFHNGARSFMHVRLILLAKIPMLLDLSLTFVNLLEVASSSQDFSLILSISLLWGMYVKVLKK